MRSVKQDKTWNSPLQDYYFIIWIPDNGSCTHPMFKKNASVWWWDFLIHSHPLLLPAYKAIVCGHLCDPPGGGGSLFCPIRKMFSQTIWGWVLEHWKKSFGGWGGCMPVPQLPLAGTKKPIQKLVWALVVSHFCQSWLDACSASQEEIMLAPAAVVAAIWKCMICLQQHSHLATF